jgi:hypothetical protein
MKKLILSVLLTLSLTPLTLVEAQDNRYFCGSSTPNTATVIAVNTSRNLSVIRSRYSDAHTCWYGNSQYIQVATLSIPAGQLIPNSTGIENWLSANGISYLIFKN